MYRLLVVFIAILVPAVGASQTTTAPVPAVAALTFDFTEVAPGVHVAIARGVPYYVANSVVIIGGDDVLLVDSSAGPGEGATLRQAIRTLTPRPIRYVVDTHFHFDHALGHAAFPGAVTIGHVETRAGLMLGVRQPTLASNIAALPGRAGTLRAQAAAEGDRAKREGLERDAASTDAYGKALAALAPSTSDLTFSDGLTVWLGTREVRILHLGRGHTAGDTVVYLPAERVICTGDLFNGYIGYMGDAFVDEWAETLGRLAQIDFQTVVAGHGQPFRGKERIAPVQACLRDLWRQAEAMKRAGTPANEAAARVDLRAHAAQFPALATVGFTPLAVARIYAVIDARTAGQR